MIENNQSLPGLPRGWAWTELENCVDVLDGKRVPINAKEREARIGSKLPSELFPYYGATGQVGWVDGFLFDEELVLLGEDGAPFLDPFEDKAYVIKGKTWVNNHAHVLRALSGMMSSAFLCYYLNIFNYHGYVTGTTRFKLNQAPMRKIPTPLAPFGEQVRIVARLEELFTRLDVGVEGLRKVKAQLKHYRQAVLKYAFEGKLTEEWRKTHKQQTEPARKLLEHVQQERRKTRTENESLTSLRVGDLPPLPENWIWTAFGQLLESSQNGISKRRGAEGKPVHVLRLSDIAEGKIVSASPRDIKLTDSETEKFLLNRGDLLCIRVNGSRNLAGRLIVFDKNGSWAFCDHFKSWSIDDDFKTGILFESFASYSLDDRKTQNLTPQHIEITLCPRIVQFYELES